VLESAMPAARHVLERLGITDPLAAFFPELHV
jgi:hypothetical protein